MILAPESRRAIEQAIAPTFDSLRSQKRLNRSVGHLSFMKLYKNLTFRIVEDREILGVLLPAFIHNVQYHLTNIIVYADAMVDCWGLVDWKGFILKVDSGWVVTSLPEGAEVSVHPITYFTAKDILYRVPESEFIKQALDAVEELNGRPSSLELFIKAKKRYWEEPNDENRALMREAFERVPHQMKKYVLNERDKRYFKEQGIESYETVWELDEGNSVTP
jgi:hypothetical protein